MYRCYHELQKNVIFPFSSENVALFLILGLTELYMGPGSVFSKHMLCYCAIADTTYCVNKKRKTQVLVMIATGQRSLNHTSVSHWFHSVLMTTLRASGEIRHFFTFLL